MYHQGMRSLIERPQAVVTRQHVEAAVARLVREPNATRAGALMRMVDEYAASRHTERVYAHAENVIAQALIGAHHAKESDSNIFIVIDEDGGKIFKKGEIDKKLVEKIYFKSTFGRAARVLIMDAPRPEPARPQMVRPKTVSAQTVSTRKVDVSTVWEQTICAPTIIPRTDDASPVCVPTNDAQPVSAPTNDMPSDKPCTVCKEIKDLTAFTRNRSRADGYASACRVCEQDRKRSARERQKAEPSAPCA